MSKRNQYKKQRKSIIEYYQKQRELCMQEIAQIKQICIAAGLVRTR